MSTGNFVVAEVSTAGSTECFTGYLGYWLTTAPSISLYSDCGLAKIPSVPSRAPRLPTDGHTGCHTGYHAS